MIRETRGNSETEFCLTLWLLGKSSKSKNTPTDHPHGSLHAVLKEKRPVIPLSILAMGPWGRNKLAGGRRPGTTFSFGNRMNPTRQWGKTASPPHVLLQSYATVGADCLSSDVLMLDAIFEK
jgi:hypothetical protein